MKISKIMRDIAVMQIINVYEAIKGRAGETLSLLFKICSGQILAG